MKNINKILILSLLIVANVDARPLRSRGSVSPNVDNILKRDNVKPLLFITGAFLTLSFLGQRNRTRRIIRDVSNELTKVVSVEMQRFVNDN